MYCAGMLAHSDTAEDRSTWRALTTRGKVETVIIWVVFALYVVFLLKLLLFSRTPGSERSINLIPFASVADYLFSGSAGTKRFAFANLAGNVLLFIPLGAYLALLTRMTVARTMLVVASVSVAVEIIQGVFALGASDIDDVILNCLGGFLGILLFVLLRAVLRGRTRARTAMAVLSILALPVLSYFLFVIRLLM